ncbi:MAG: hypothetical protein NT096_09075 [Proteobacteria bacterium]|nr:hypothetical protein [Pseudomonadota bacterium]
MKKGLMIGIALAVAFAFTGMLMAAEPAAPAKQEATKEEVFRGTVVSVDAVANTIVVNNKKANKEETFQVDSKTKITFAKKEYKLADIKKDQKVAVHYRVEGDKKIATLIR